MRAPGTPTAPAPGPGAELRHDIPDRLRRAEPCGTLHNWLVTAGTHLALVHACCATTAQACGQVLWDFGAADLGQLRARRVTAAEAARYQRLILFAQDNDR